MRRFFTAAAMTVCIVSLAATVSADTLVLRDGSRIEGTVLAIVGRTITFRHADGASHRYPTSRIEAIEFFAADREPPRDARVRRETPADITMLTKRLGRPGLLAGR
jgi:hypothetical protein